MEPSRLLRVNNGKNIKNIKHTQNLLGVAVRLPCDCNFKCIYCYSQTERGGLYHEDILLFIKQAIDLGAKSVSFVGEGEPFLYRVSTIYFQGQFSVVGTHSNRLQKVVPMR